jgi:hypothetical protein
MTLGISSLYNPVTYLEVSKLYPIYKAYLY